MGKKRSRPVYKNLLLPPAGDDASRSQQEIEGKKSKSKKVKKAKKRQDEAAEETTGERPNGTDSSVDAAAAVPRSGSSADDRFRSHQQDALPVRRMRSEFLAAFAAHQTIVLVAETGSGKSTQLPQILLEEGLVAPARRRRRHRHDRGQHAVVELLREAERHRAALAGRAPLRRLALLCHVHDHERRLW